MKKVFLLLLFVSFVSCGGGDDDENEPQVEITTPQISTKPIINIESNFASSGGTIISDGNSPILQKGVCWSKNPNPTISGNLANDFSVDGSGTGSFVSELDDLEPNTTYYVRAYATNAVGTAYGSELSFTTLDGGAPMNIYTGTVYLHNQGDVISFGSNNYTHINGSLIIGSAPNGNEITDLSPLGALTSVSSQLSIFGCDLIPNLEGLNNLITVGQNFQIEGNSSLTDLSALSNLTTVVTEFRIGSNQLTNLNGLSSLNSVGLLNLFVNEELIEISGLSNLTEITDGISITWNNNLTNLNGLENISNLGDFLIINGNVKLENIDGLSNINSVGGLLDIRYNDMLLNIDGLNSLESIGGDLTLFGNNNLLNISGLSNLYSVGGGNIRFEQNHSVNDLSGFLGLNSIDGQFLIKQTGLTSLNGLNNLSSVGSLIIEQNNPLISIEALSGLTTINDHFAIIENGNLSNLEGLNNLTSVSSSISFSNNNLLDNFCALQPALLSSFTGSYYMVDNAYNPTQQDLIDGNCSF